MAALFRFVMSAATFQTVECLRFQQAKSVSQYTSKLSLISLERESLRTIKRRSVRFHIAAVSRVDRFNVGSWYWHWQGIRPVNIRQGWGSRWQSRYDAQKQTKAAASTTPCFCSIDHDSSLIGIWCR